MAELTWEELAQKAQSGAPLDSKSESVAPKTREKVSAGESYASGAVQGASFGFADELEGALKTLDSLPKDLANRLLSSVLARKVGEPEKPYTQYRDEARARYEAARQDNPNAYLAGELTGGVATAAIPGVGAVKGPATLARAVKIGSGAGAVAGLGSSNATDIPGAIIDTGAGAVGGALVGGALYGAGKVVGAIRKVIKSKSGPGAAQVLAESTAPKMNELEAVSQAVPRSNFYDQSMALQEKYSNELGEPFKFRPGQATADPSLALAELKAANFPQTMSAAQSLEAKQLQQTARILDNKVHLIASKPQALGNSNIGQSVTDALDNHIESLMKARSSAAGPHYDAAANSGTMIDTTPIEETLSEIISQNKYNPSQVTGQIRTILRRIKGENLAKVEAANEQAAALAPAPMKFESKDRMLKDMIKESLGSTDSSPTEQADSLYRRFKKGSGRKPAPYGDEGMFDVVNEYLNLSGDKKVSSLAEAWDKLTVNAKTFADREKAVRILRQVDGLDNPSMPEKLREQAALELEHNAFLDDAPDVALSSMSIKDVQSLRSLMSKAAYSGENIIDGMDSRQQRYFAKKVLESIDLALDKTASEGGDGAAELVTANKIWRDYSQQIDSAATDTVKRILRTGDNSQDTITSKILRSSPDEIKGVFRVLNKANPGVAQSTRAALLNDIFTAGGKPVPGSIAEQEGVGRIRPKTVMDSLIKNEPRLMAAFEGDAKAQDALRESYALLKRISFGPGIKGSTTAPQLEQALQEAGSSIAQAAIPAGGGLQSIALQKTSNFVIKVIGDTRAANTVYSSPENIDLFNKAMRSELSKKPATSKQLAAIEALAEQLGIKIGE